MSIAQFSMFSPVASTSRWRRSLPQRTAALACGGLLALAASRAGATDPSWPMYQGNPAHTGYVPVKLNTSAFALRWTKALSAGVALDPATAAEGKVFVSSSGGLFVLDAATGSVLWSTSFGSVFSVNPPSYGYGNVYLQNGNGFGSYSSALHAYQASTGLQLFSSPVSAQWERYLAPTLYDGNVYVDGGYYGGMYSFNATNGLSNWFGYVGQYDGWTPAVDTNYCYVFTGSGDTVPILGQFRMIDRFTGLTRYLVIDNGFQWNGYTMNAAVTLGTNNDAFAMNEAGLVYPSSSANGRLLRFELRTDGTNTPHVGWVLSDHFTGQPTLANGVLYANDGGHVAALDEQTGQLLWSWTPPSGGVTGTMIVTENLLLARTLTTTYAVDLGSHQAVWSYPVSGHLALGEGVLYAAGGNGSLTAITAPSIPVPTNHPPIARIGGPYIAECQGALTAVQLDGSASSDPDGNPLTFTWSANCPGASFDNPASATPKLTLGSYSGQPCTVTLVVSDGQFSATNSTTVTVVDTTPPVLACATNKMVECGSPLSFDSPIASDTCCGTDVVLTVVSTVTNAPTSPRAIANITRTWLATDCAGNTNWCSQTVTIQDTQPPFFSVVSVDPATLWPPDHKLVPVTITATVSDACDPAPTWRITSVSSSDPTPGAGIEQGPDYQITGSNTLLLRAERNDPRAGRTYQVTLQATDGSGNVTVANVVVKVPGAGK